MTGTDSLDLRAMALVNLLRLSSPALPVGAYSYSQGLEWAVECGRVRSEDDARAWIGGLLDSVITHGEARLAARLHRAWRRLDRARLWEMETLSLASRETAELRAETLQMGYSLAQLLGDLRLIDAPRRELLAALTPCSFVCVYALAAVAMDIGETATLIGLMWSWLENQVAAAIKVVPLGQLAGQRLLAALSPRLPVLAARAAAAETEMDNFAPALAIASSRHESQYSRLFRS